MAEAMEVRLVDAEKVREMQRKAEETLRRGDILNFPFAIMRRSVLRELGPWEEKEEA